MLILIFAKKDEKKDEKVKNIWLYIKINIKWEGCLHWKNVEKIERNGGYLYETSFKTSVGNSDYNSFVNNGCVCGDKDS